MTASSSPPIRQAVGIDVGGTKTAAARVDRDGAVLALETLATPADDVDATLATIVEAARSVITPDVGAVGIAAAGLVEWGTGELAFAPNLAWRKVSLSPLPRVRARAPGRRRQRQHGRCVGRVPLRRGPRLRGPPARRRRHRDRRRDRDRGQVVPRRARVRGRDRAHRDGSGRPGVRVREPGVLGAVGVRSGRRPGGARGDRRAAPTRRSRRTTEGDPSRVTGGDGHAERRATATPVSVAILAEVGHWLGVGIGGLVNILDPEIV